MRLTVDLTKENGFRVKAGQNVFVCDQAFPNGMRHNALTPVELFMAGLGASIANRTIAFCKEKALSTSGFKVMMDWAYTEDEKRIGRIDVAVRRPESVSDALEDDFMCAIHQSDIYQTLQVKPEIHYHATMEVEKPEGEALIHFVGAE
jgi:hypothetical protein